MPRWVRKPSPNTSPSGPLASAPVIQSPQDPVAPLLKPFHGSLVHSDKIQSPHCGLGSPWRLASVTSLSSLSPTQLLAHSAPPTHQAPFQPLDLQSSWSSAWTSSLMCLHDSLSPTSFPALFFSGMNCVHCLWTYLRLLLMFIVFLSRIFVHFFFHRNRQSP